MRLGHYLCVDLRTKTEFDAFYTGDYDTILIKRFTRLFTDGWQVVDAGANIGFYSVPFASALHQYGGRVHSFEPVAPNTTRLKYNLLLNGLGRTAVVNELGLSNTSGVALLALREDFAMGGETGNAAMYIDDGKDDGFVKVPMDLTTIDYYVQNTGLERLDFIKADVEGHEDLVIEGALTSIARFRPLIFAEANSFFLKRRGVDLAGKLRGLLDGLDYVLATFSRSGTCKAAAILEDDALSANILLIPAEQSDRVFAVLNASDGNSCRPSLFSAVRRPRGWR